MTCEYCEDTGHVCENHPDKVWNGISDSENSCKCGGAGMPCKCCEVIPQDGKHSIIEAFIPKKQSD